MDLETALNHLATKYSIQGSGLMPSEHYIIVTEPIYKAVWVQDPNDREILKEIIECLK